MSATAVPESMPGAVEERRLPPVREIGVAALGLVIVGGIYLASHIPNGVSLALPTALLIAAGVLLIADVALLATMGPFAWGVFFRVGGWAQLAYIVIAGMIEYAFLYDGTRGGTLVVLTLSLVVFAVDVPLLLAFSVARHQAPGGRQPTRPVADD